jgi:hypothetical protein
MRLNLFVKRWHQEEAFAHMIDVVSANDVMMMMMMLTNF